MNSSHKTLEQAKNEINSVHPGTALYVDAFGLQLSKRGWNLEVQNYVGAYAAANGFKLELKVAPWRPHLLTIEDD